MSVLPSCRYTAFGLQIESDVPLNEFPPGDQHRTADILVRCHPAEPVADEAAAAVRVNGEIRFVWPGLGRFTIRDGARIDVNPVPGVSPSILRMPLMGTVLSMLLHQRGLLMLHASAVCINGRTVGFLGRRGQGKSTLCAALYERGHALVSDDVLAVEMREGQPWVLPGVPFFKLWADSVTHSLKEDPANRPTLVEGYEKLGCSATDRLIGQPVRLHRVYFLEAGDDYQVIPLEEARFALNLITHSIASRFGRDLLHGADQARHLQLCADFARTTSGAYLIRPKKFEELPTLLSFVENDVAR